MHYTCNARYNPVLSSLSKCTSEVAPYYMITTPVPQLPCGRLTKTRQPFCAIIPSDQNPPLTHTALSRGWLEKCLVQGNNSCTSGDPFYHLSYCCPTAPTVLTRTHIFDITLKHHSSVTALLKVSSSGKCVVQVLWHLTLWIMVSCWQDGNIWLGCQVQSIVCQVQSMVGFLFNG